MYTVQKEFKPGTEIRPAAENEIGTIRKLAEKIFPPTYQSIVPAGQVDYMMEMMYSTSNLASQMEKGQQFLILYHAGQPAGFASYSALDRTDDFSLNKIYLDYDQQGQGLGRILLFEVIRRVREAGGKKLLLNVNKHNMAAGFYRNLGFTILKEEMLDIGGGYFMDDFIMQLDLTSP